MFKPGEKVRRRHDLSERAWLYDCYMPGTLKDVEFTYIRIDKNNPSNGIVRYYFDDEGGMNYDSYSCPLVALERAKKNEVVLEAE